MRTRKIPQNKNLRIWTKDVNLFSGMSREGNKTERTRFRDTIRMLSEMEGNKDEEQGKQHTYW